VPASGPGVLYCHEVSSHISAALRKLIALCHLCSVNIELTSYALVTMYLFTCASIK